MNVVSLINLINRNKSLDKAYVGEDYGDFIVRPEIKYSHFMSKLQLVSQRVLGNVTVAGTI